MIFRFTDFLVPDNQRHTQKHFQEYGDHHQLDKQSLPTLPGRHPRHHVQSDAKERHDQHTQIHKSQVLGDGRDQRLQKQRTHELNRQGDAEPDKKLLRGHDDRD